MFVFVDRDGTAGAAAALYGPLHGGANEAVLRMLTEIGSVNNIPGFIKRVKAGEGRLMGFGHRVYKSYDPRAKIIKRTAYEVFEVTGKNPLLDIALELERIALEIDKIQGRLEFLRTRAAMSTISVAFTVKPKPAAPIVAPVAETPKTPRRIELPIGWMNDVGIDRVKSLLDKRVDIKLTEGVKIDGNPVEGAKGAPPPVDTSANPDADSDDFLKSAKDAGKAA